MEDAECDVDRRTDEEIGGCDDEIHAVGGFGVVGCRVGWLAAEKCCVGAEEDAEGEGERVEIW